MVKNISIIGTVGVPATYGGFETLVDNLLDADIEQVTVYCSGLHYNSTNRLSSYKNAKLIYLPLKANGISSIFYDGLSLLHAGFMRADTILILGVSGCIFLPLFRLLSTAKVITNIDGLEWRRDKWSTMARKFLKYSEKIAIRFSHVIVSDNQAIADYVSEEYGVTSEIIAYGGDHAFKECRYIDNSAYALALCRIEPENNVAMILEAFSQTDMRLKFVGNWDNSEFGRNLKRHYGRIKNIEIVDPIYDLDELAKLRNGCQIYIHGHSAGGTNPSLVEMMHFAKPIYCFDCSYNRATTENKSAYFSGVESLKALISCASYSDMGKDMQEIANRRYTWGIVSKKYLELL